MYQFIMSRTEEFVTFLQVAASNWPVKSAKTKSTEAYNLEAAMHS